MLLTHTNTLTQTRTHTQSHSYSTLQTECPHKVVFCLLIKEVAGLRKIPTSVSLFTNSRGTEALCHRSNRVSDNSLKGFDTLCQQQPIFCQDFWSALSFLYAKDSHHWYASHSIIYKIQHLQFYPLKCESLLFYSALHYLNWVLTQQKTHMCSLLMCNISLCLFPFSSSAQPVLYWCSRNISVWSNVSFNLAVLMNLLVCFFYPLEGVHGGQSVQVVDSLLKAEHWPNWLPVPKLTVTSPHLLQGFTHFKSGMKFHSWLCRRLL